MIFICVAIAVSGDTGRQLLQYDRVAISDGEYCRLLSGHFTHLGYSHLLLNLAGLVLVWLLVGSYYDNRSWLLVIAVSVATVSACFWWLERDLIWYVGLSGVLHGLLMAGAVRGLKSRPGESALLLVIVIAKLGYEQLAGPLPGSESASGGAVIVAAHLYGAIGGLLAALPGWLGVAAARSI